MPVQPISAVNVKNTVSRFGKELTNHNLTKASLDAPILSELAGYAPANIKANYFPFDANVEKIEIKAKEVVKDIINEADYTSDCALHF